MSIVAEDKLVTTLVLINHQNPKSQKLGPGCIQAALTLVRIIAPRQAVPVPRTTLQQASAPTHY